jgi:hypothetical protein
VTSFWTVLSYTSTDTLYIGCDDAAYHPLLQDLVRSGMEDRLLILRTSALSNPLKKLGLMTIRAPDSLFDAGSITASATVLSTVDGYSASSSPSAMPSPPTSPVPASPTQTRLARLSETWRKRGQSDGELRLDPTLVSPSNLIMFRFMLSMDFSHPGRVNYD